MASNRTREVLAVNGIKTDLWLTADKEVLPLTGQKPELHWEALRKQNFIFDLGNSDRYVMLDISPTGGCQF